MIPPGYRKRIGRWRGQFVLAWLRAARRVAGAFGLRGIYYRHLAGNVLSTGLFDAAWYLEHNADVREVGVDPLLHYVRHGDREGRQPMPLFDPLYYRAHAGERAGDPNSLLHYALLGRFLKVATSAWFDTEYYLRQNRDVSRSGADPLRHYLQGGGAAGRSPCRQFDAAFYLEAYPEVAASGVDPLLHYLQWGRLEGRRTHNAGAEAEPAVSAEAAPADPWHGVSPHPALGAVLDVVVPVYGGHAETLRCLRSVLASRNRTPFELVVIDDASPDAALSACLVQGAEAGLFTLVVNTANQGFVATANRGLALHTGRDVILLNADTQVFGDWVDRLCAAAARDPRAGTVTPLSNNATIASYPRFLHDNPYPLELSYAELDALAARTNAGLVCEAPTGVGFCMYMRRGCLDEVGSFDEDAFGRGYGEENDFCQRAIAAGWRNLIAADVFVHHLGSVSFRGERARRVSEAMRVLDRRHPSYQRDVRRFIELDPLASARERLDWARLRHSRMREHNVLMVCHNRGGGAERHMREDMARFEADGLGVFVLRPVPGSATGVRLTDRRNVALPNLPHFTLDPDGPLAGALRDLAIRCVHVHGTVDFEVDAPERLAALAAAVGASLEVEIHDYQVLCPRINLADRRGVYCGEPDEAGCNACLATNGSKYMVRSIRAWRDSHAVLLRAAAQVHVPDADAAARLRRYYPELALTVDPHEFPEPGDTPVRTPLLGAGEALHVAVIGAIGRVKGYDVLLSCARDARERRLPLRFSLLGYSMDDAALAQAGVSISGRYLEAEAESRLAAIAPHVVWLPSLWPETYSYTLSLALRAGLPVFGFDIGAIGRRLRAIGREEGLVALERHAFPDELNRVFLEYRERSIGCSAAAVA